MTRRAFIFLGTAIGLLLISSCGGSKTGLGVSAYKAYNRPAKLPTDRSKVHVKVSTVRQRVYVMEGDKPLLIMPVSVGIPEDPTPTGHFKIFKKVEQRRDPSNGFAYSGDRIKKIGRRDKPSGWAFEGYPLPYWCEFKPNYAFHTGWIKHVPCSNGCIRMHENVAPKFFRLVDEGTPVHIAETLPEDRKFANIPLPPDAGPLPDYSQAYYISGDYFTDHQPATFR